MDENRKNRTIEDYEDIIDLPRPVSKKHPQMSDLNRAAQFAPFAALTGFEGKIAQTEINSEEKRSE